MLIEKVVSIQMLNISSQAFYSMDGDLRSKLYKFQDSIDPQH